MEGVRDVHWAVVVPVKRLPEAKSRLRLDPSAPPRERLALAMALDTVAAAAACPAVAEVLVVTADPVAAAELRRLGARVVPEPRGPGHGLNAAVRRGAGQVAAGVGVAALAADLPALRSGELAAALAAAGEAAPAGGFTADSAGTGTTLLAAPPGARLRPRFGPGSAAAHAAAGLRRLDGEWPSLRRDVDTVDDLVEAVRLGLGPHTAASLAVPPEGRA